MIESDLLIRPCHGFAELETCVELQEQVWGYADRDIIPRRLFTVAQRIGGHIFGAFHPSTSASTNVSMVGFAMALPAMRHQLFYLHSHMLAVRPDWRNAGVGRALKLAQRDEALARGILKMEWTFDPLESKNAYLNIAKLGVIVRSYTPDFYGPTSSSLQAGLQSDRMHAEWFLEHDRVRAILAGTPLPAAPIVQTITIPAALPAWKCSTADVGKAAIVQKSNRNLFLAAFQNGLAVVGFSRDGQGNGIYHLSASPETSAV